MIDKERLRKLVHRGLTDRQIGALLDHKPETVARSRLRMGLEANRKPVVIRHGKRSTYVHHGCRCDRCRAANARYYRNYCKKKKGARGG